MALLTREASKVGPEQRLQQRASKMLHGAAKASEDAATLRKIVGKINDDMAVMFQEGDGKGRRFQGAKSHEFADQLDAYNRIVTTGNIPVATK